MQYISWKKVGLIMLAIFLLLFSKKAIVFLEECRLGELFVDSVDYLWTLPQGLRFTLLSAFFLMFFMAGFKLMMKKKVNEDKRDKSDHIF